MKEFDFTKQTNTTVQVLRQYRELGIYEVPLLTEKDISDLKKEILIVLTDEAQDYWKRNGDSDEFRTVGYAVRTVEELGIEW